MLKLIIVVTVLASAVWDAHQSTPSRAKLDERVVGGVSSTIETHPYMVSVLENGSHICGGSIISATWIASAAHCFLNNDSLYSIRAGSSILNSGGQVINANKIIIHNKFNNITHDYDIALIKLSGDITTPIADAIALATQGTRAEAGVTATITGWGYLAEDGPLPTTLQVVQVPIVSQADCREAYGPTAITDRMLCAGLLEEGGKDACQEDSGSPLVANGFLTGIVSWGSGCARPHFPGVYTKVASLRTWIRRNSGI